MPALERIDPTYEQLSKAASVDEVVGITREYLARWNRQNIERLPATCRPAWVKDAGDIERWADRLAEESAQAQLVLEDERKLDRLTSHFLIASVRIRQLAGELASTIA